jgi:hypothetical protein
VSGSCLRITLLVCAGLLSGCGGGSGGSTVEFRRAGPPPPEECLKKFNESPGALQAGAHTYRTGHESRAAHVLRMTDSKIRVPNGCVVVFAARESDREYGILGLVELQTGWGSMAYLSLTPKERAALQKKGVEQANAQLREDGTIAPFE